MNLSQNGYNFIKNQEGVKNHSYQDSVGIWTIGIGFIEVAGTKVIKNQSMTDMQIEKEFFIQVVKYEDCINDNVKTILNQNQFDALVSFCYNVGCGNFKSSTLLKKININPNDKSIAQEFSKWDKAGGKVVNGLLTRRLAETQLYFKK